MAPFQSNLRAVFLLSHSLSISVQFQSRFSAVYHSHAICNCNSNPRATRVHFQCRLGATREQMQSNCWRFSATWFSLIKFCLILWRIAGGQEKLRPLWKSYTRCTDAIVFVVDSVDVERMEEAKMELMRTAKSPDNAQVILPIRFCYEPFHLLHSDVLSFFGGSANNTRSNGLRPLKRRHFCTARATRQLLAWKLSPVVFYRYHTLRNTTRLSFQPNINQMYVLGWKLSPVVFYH